MTIVERPARALTMKIILAMVLLAGCAATSGHDAHVRELERESREIAARANHCVSAAMKHGSDETETPNTSGSSTGSQTQAAKDERDREISKCKAEEAREDQQLFSQERNEYALQAEQERDRSSLMMILTTTMPR
jgi:epoxyqueuosine reductase QueG